MSAADAWIPHRSGLVRATVQHAKTTPLGALQLVSPQAKPTAFDGRLWAGQRSVLSSP